MPKNFLIEIDERKYLMVVNYILRINFVYCVTIEDEIEDKFKLTKDLSSLQNTEKGIDSSQRPSPKSTSVSPTRHSRPLTKQQKKARSKHIKKILKERLNVDCLRMIGEESGADDDEEDDGDAKKAQLLNPKQNDRQLHANDSYHGLMREIEAGDNEGLSQAFLDKNGGEAQRQQLRSFTDMFSVRDLLGVGAFGVVLLVKNRLTKEKSALKIINKERLSSRAQRILKNESTIMQTMKHPSVVSLKRIFEN